MADRGNDPGPVRKHRDTRTGKAADGLLGLCSKRSQAAPVDTSGRLR